MSCSVEAISELEFVEQSGVLVLGNVQSFSQVLEVGLGELSGVLEGGQIIANVVVVLNSLNDVSLSVGLECLLSDESVEVVEGDAEVPQVALALFESSRVSEGSLVVGNGPLGGGHHSQLVVAVGVDRAEESVLGEASHSCKQ